MDFQTSLNKIFSHLTYRLHKHVNKTTTDQQSARRGYVCHGNSSELNKKLTSRPMPSKHSCASLVSKMQRHIVARVIRKETTVYSLSTYEQATYVIFVLTIELVNKLSFGLSRILRLTSGNYLFLISHDILINCSLMYYPHIKLDTTIIMPHRLVCCMELISAVCIFRIDIKL